jgi:beta-lactam-binding protein with PASTA domain
MVPVPSVIGLTEAGAQGTLNAAGFSVRVQHQSAPSQQVGKVISQSPGPGGERPSDRTTVTITVGVAPIPSPSPTL